jgi:hypothetical protein
MKLFAVVSGGSPLYVAALTVPIVTQVGYCYGIYAGAIRFPEGILDTALLDEALLDQLELGTALPPVELSEITGTPYVAVVAPNGGESWPVGSVHNIQWTSNTGGNVKIEISRDGGGTWSTITSWTPNDGSHQWTVTGPASANCRIRVTSTTIPAATDTSNASFTIL